MDELVNPALAEDLVNGVEEDGAPYGLAQHGDPVEVEVFVVGAGAHHHHWNGPQLVACFAVTEKLVPVHPGHAQVQQDDVGGGPLLEPRDGLGSVACALDRVSLTDEEITQTLPDVIVVVHDQNGTQR